MITRNKNQHALNKSQNLSAKLCPELLQPNTNLMNTNQKLNFKEKGKLHQNAHQILLSECQSVKVKKMINVQLN